MKILNNYTAMAMLGMSTLLFSATSCDVIDQEPYANLYPDQAFTTPDRIEKTAIGMYDALQNSRFLGGRALIYGDVRGNDVNPSAQFGAMPTFTLTAQDVNTEECWQGAYRTIYETNLFLKGFEPNKGKVSVELAKQYVAEAKFIRALAHFYLVNLYAQPYQFTADASHLGVPYVTSAVDGSNVFDPSQKVSRNTVKEVYDNIIKDLTDAEIDLPVDYGDAAFSDVARATKGAAQAILMRVYLYKGDNTNALAYANKVISLNKYVLAPNYDDIFRKYNTKESIFSVAHNSQDNPNTNYALGQHYSATARRDITVSNDYLNLPGFAATDVRKSSTMIIGTGAKYTGKYTYVADWAPIIRYSEVLLTKAEALVKQNKIVDQNAIDLVNVVRKRASASQFVTADFATYQDLLNTILIERKIELAFEGQGSFDFLRNGKAIPAHGNVSEQAWGSDKVILPIPSKETQANANLIQNKGY